MDEYIKRMTAVAVVKKYEFENCPEYMRDWATKLKRAILDDLTDDLMETPAADVAPVVHGRWRFVRDDALLTAECDKCYTVQSGPLAALWDYCPNCGARMDGE